MARFIVKKDIDIYVIDKSGTRAMGTVIHFSPNQAFLTGDNLDQPQVVLLRSTENESLFVSPEELYKNVVLGKLVLAKSNFSEEIDVERTQKIINSYAPPKTSHKINYSKVFAALVLLGAGYAIYRHVKG